MLLGTKPAQFVEYADPLTPTYIANPSQYMGHISMLMSSHHILLQWIGSVEDAEMHCKRMNKHPRRIYCSCCLQPVTPSDHRSTTDIEGLKHMLHNNCPDMTSASPWSPPQPKKRGFFGR
jgi:hypothetical protein